MSRVRFATARAVFEAFPELAQKIAAAPTDHSPTDFLKRLSSEGRIPDAVTFCAYLLPRREAVWWACGCVRALSGEVAADRAAGLVAAEAWVYAPDDKHRQEALAVGTAGDRNDPLTWLALAAGWAGGVMANPHRPVPVPPYMTARAARLAVLFSASKIGRAERFARLQAGIAEGLRLAENGL